jgi:NAD(P)-dependent dehydrogenase (short-subunit alcohol dehydrogenase family)
MQEMRTKTALVTGANRGIGLAIAAGLNRLDGIKVLVGSRRAEHGENAAKTLAGNAVDVQLDLSNAEDLRRQVKNITDVHGPVDILVNNAGVLEPGNILEIESNKLNYSLQVNFLAALELIRELVPGMKARGYGRVVNVSSGWGSFAEGLSGPAAYSISKAALNALTLSLAKDLPKNVKVNSMDPGWVRTRMGGDAAPRAPEQGAETAIWLATLSDNGPSGGFYRDRSSIEW